MTAPVSVQRIGRGKRDLDRFLDVAERLYRSDPNWVAPLRSDLAKVFLDENPFFRHAEMQLFVARRGSADVGRIAAIVDRAHNEFHGEKTAFFGFFECENDPEAAAALLERADQWLRGQGCDRMVGPADFTTND
ncbi:MAG TPA: hypothetical protein VFW15_01300, partial [Thermoanaerobaculia bacterium]|nr:hypothetical protein [Thermoanaerobaculia bacterium]